MKDLLRFVPRLAYILSALSVLEIVLLKFLPTVKVPHDVYDALALGFISAFLGLLTHSYLVSVEDATRTREKIFNALENIRRHVEESTISEIPSTEIQNAGRDFAERCDGEMHWFNVPLGRCIPPHFEAFLKPAIENERVASIVFMLDRGVQATWENFVKPHVARVEKNLISQKARLVYIFMI
jgi:hypothetical protein